MGPATFEGQSLDESIEVLAISGELDMSNSSELRRRVERALREGRHHVVIDLDRLTHMDSSGLAALIDCHQLAEARGGRFALVITSESVRRTVEVRGLDRLFTILPSIDAALEALRP
jgi:anti-sigma B factor antagonist